MFDPTAKSTSVLKTDVNESVTTEGDFKFTTRVSRGEINYTVETDYNLSADVLDFYKKLGYELSDRLKNYVGIIIV